MDMKDFKMAIKEYITLDAKISGAEKTIKLLKVRKADLYDSVFQFMQHKQIKQLNLPNGEKLKTVTKKVRGGTGKKWVETRLHEYCHMNCINYDEIYKFIYDTEHRPQTEKEALKKIKPKK